jgi:hypothetical protein
VLARLSGPLSHAAGAAVGGTFFVLGGRGDSLSSQRATILAIDPATGRVRQAGRLPVALSDLSATTVGGNIVVVGGRDPSGRVHGQVWTMQPR